MASRLRPLNTRIVIKPDNPDERTKSGIIIPDNAKVKPARGTMVAMGPGMLMKTGQRWPMPGMKPGDKVMYSQYAGTEIEVDGVLHIVMRDDDVFACGPADDRLLPCSDRVMLKCDEAPDKSKGGIIIPDSAKERPLEGEVIAVGPGKTLEDGTIRPLDVKPGERVKFQKHQGTDVKIGSQTFRFFREDDLLGVVESVP